MTTCFYCGEQEHVALGEIWGHEFTIDTCCAGLFDEVVTEMQDPSFRTAFLRNLEVEAWTGGSLRRVADDHGHLVLDYALDIRPIRFSEVRAFVARHHRHCPAPTAWRWGASIWNRHTLVGVISIGRPVARALDQQAIVEVNRLCLDLTLPSVLRWNAASQLYGWAAREARRRGYCKIITYTMIDEQGTTLRAAGWTPEHVTRAKSWNNAKRPRTNKTPLVDKIRWSRTFKPLPARPAPLFEYADLAA